MRRAALILLVALGLGPGAATAPGPVVRLVELDDPITPVSAERLSRAIDEAERSGDALVLIRLDTEGGLVASLETMVQKMLAARTPTAAWVGPAGAKAASAGFVVLIAADVAAMAPGTHTGAAAVISSLVGANPKEDVGLLKAAKDLAARARTIAEHRGRNVEACEKAVLAAEAYSDRQALESHVVDLVAASADDLVAQLDGRQVTRLDGETITLALKGYRIEKSEDSLRLSVLGILANPLVSYLLLLLGLAGLYIELSHPGLVLPGVVGVLSLLLFAFSAQVLPVSSIGVLLVLLGLVLFILEIKVTSYGMLAVGGTACLLLGSMMLYRGPVDSLRLPLAVVLPASLTLAALCAVAVRLALKAQRAPVATGVEGLRGEVGVVDETLTPYGKVFVHGEIWSAFSPSGPIPRGTRVRVVRVDDMTIVVEPESTSLRRE